MKKTQWLALFRDIKATIVSFLSITLFVALGIAIFLGIKWTAPALEAAGNAYYEEHSYHDLALAFPYALSNDDLRAVEALGLAAEGMYSANGTAMIDGKRSVLAILSLTQRIDTATAVSGVMPSAPGEVGIERLLAKAAGLDVGDTLTIFAGSNGHEPLRQDAFTITAIVEHPSYIRNENAFTRGISNIGNGTVDYYVVLPEAAFDPDAFGFCYPQILVRDPNLRGLDTFGEAYKARVGEIAAQLKALGEERSALRCDNMFARYSAEISKGEDRLDNAERGLEKGKLEAENARQELIDGEKKLASGEKTIAQNEKKLREAEQEYAEGLLKYRDGQEQLASGGARLRSALTGAGYSTSISSAQSEISGDLSMLNKIRRVLAAVRDDIAQNSAAQDATATTLQAQKVSDVLRPLLTGSDGAGARLSRLLDEAGSLSDENKTALRGIISKFENDPAYVITSDELAKLKVIPFDILINKLDSLISDLNRLLDGIDEYIEGAKELAEARRKLQEAAISIEEGREELKAGKRRLKNAKAELENGRIELAEAEQAIADAEIEIAKKKTEIADAKAELNDFVRYEGWTLQKRFDNASFAVVQACSESSNKLCYAVALLFVFVGLMVCYTAIARNVREGQVLTGVQKALGLRKREILLHYIAYAVLAVALGLAAGGALGYYGIEAIMNKAYLRTFAFERIPNIFSAKDLLMIGALELLLICIAAYIPCRKLLKRQAVELLRGDSNGGGRTRFYEKSKLWQRCSLYTQTTVNNLVNDSARVIATLVGVAGCTALVVMAMSVELNMINTPPKHFDSSWRYDARLVCDKEVPGALSNLCNGLDAENVSYAAALQDTLFIDDANGKVKADLIVPEQPENLSAFIGLNDWKSKQPLTLPEDGALISRTYAKYFGTNVGDTLRLLDMSGVYHECVVAGVTEHYLSTYQLVMSRPYYAQVMGAPAESNTLYLNYGQRDPAEVQAKLDDVDGYFSCTDEFARWTGIFEGFQKNTMIFIYICLALAALMALMVLINLNVAFINEKAKELIIMRINGFSIGAAKKYIYRDNIVLTVLGILLGVGAGLLLAIVTTHNLERTGDNYYIAVNMKACLTGAGMSSLFSLISNLIALRRVDKLKISDIGRM